MIKSVLGGEEHCPIFLYNINLFNYSSNGMMINDPLATKCQKYGSTSTISESNNKTINSGYHLDEETEDTRGHGQNRTNMRYKSTDSLSSECHAKINHELSLYQLTLSTTRTSSDSLSHDTVCDCQYSGSRSTRNCRNNPNPNEIKFHQNYKLLKLLLSFVIWFICYMIMGTVGGTLAFMHFPRTASNRTEPLPDFGYAAIPYVCPIIHLGEVIDMNIQDLVLSILYWTVLSGCTYRYFYLRRNRNQYEDKCYMPNKGNDGNQNDNDQDDDVLKKLQDGECRSDLHKRNEHDPEIVEVEVNISREESDHDTSFTSSTKSKQSHPRLILQQLLHLNSILFLTRTSVVFATGLPQPNPRCINVQHDVVNYHQAFAFVMLRGFPPHACGDLIYSGHVGCILICMFILNEHAFLKRRIVSVIMWCVATAGILSTISCRSHYTVDVILAFYFSFGIKEFYFTRRNFDKKGSIGSFICWLEN